MLERVRLYAYKVSVRAAAATRCTAAGASRQLVTLATPLHDERELIDRLAADAGYAPTF